VSISNVTVGRGLKCLDRRSGSFPNVPVRAAKVARSATSSSIGGRLRLGFDLLIRLATRYSHRVSEFLRHQCACVGRVGHRRRRKCLFKPILIVPERFALTATTLTELVQFLLRGVG